MASWFGANSNDLRQSLNELQTRVVLVRERAAKFGFELTAAGLEDVETKLRKVFTYLQDDIAEAERIP